MAVPAELNQWENRIQTIEGRQDRLEVMVSNTVEQVRELTISLARQEERLASIDRTTTSIFEMQARRDEQDKIATSKEGRHQASLAQGRLLWAAGAVLALILLVLNTIIIFNAV
jgi:hypothetical protein